jgi:hypothetical protein
MVGAMSITDEDIRVDWLESDEAAAARPVQVSEAAVDGDGTDGTDGDGTDGGSSDGDGTDGGSSDSDGTDGDGDGTDG